MNETMPSSSDWFQYYEQTAINEHAFSSSSSSSFGFSDPTIVKTSGQLIPNNKSSCVSKPMRRRSRASKKTPTTLLNANASNFRALVQQFTGRHRTPTTSFGRTKGPINLNFQLGSVQNHSSIDQNTIRAPLSNATITTTANCYNYDQYYQRQQQHLEQPQQLLEHQSSLDDLFFPSTDVTNIEILADELLKDDFSLHESFSNENIHDACF